MIRSMSENGVCILFSRQIRAALMRSNADFFLLVFSQNLQPQICAETHTGDLVKGYFSAKGREDGLTGSGTEMERHTDTVI